MPRSKINKKMLRGLEFNSDVVKTKTEEEFVNICLGYAEDEKCAALIVELSEKYKEDYLREYATYETDLALAKNITIDLLAKSVVIEEIDRVVSWDYLSKRMLFQDFLEYKQLMEKE